MWRPMVSEDVSCRVFCGQIAAARQAQEARGSISQVGESSPLLGRQHRGELVHGFASHLRKRFPADALAGRLKVKWPAKCHVDGGAAALLPVPADIPACRRCRPG